VTNRLAAAAGLLLAVAALACSDLIGQAGATTPEEKGRAVQGAFAVNRAACELLLRDATIPRDESAERYCAVVLGTDWSKPLECAQP
jgi:hypothetical protein